ncbi:MAG: hypothetical protein JWN64_61 [Parcubacteria group bacterium]|nr:hypothetical protein [Parcubacteria group bacterium]
MQVIAEGRTLGRLERSLLVTDDFVRAFKQSFLLLRSFLRGLLQLFAAEHRGESQDEAEAQHRQDRDVLEREEQEDRDGRDDRAAADEQQMVEPFHLMPRQVVRCHDVVQQEERAAARGDDEAGLADHVDVAQPSEHDRCDQQEERRGTHGEQKGPNSLHIYVP